MPEAEFLAIEQLAERARQSGFDRQPDRLWRTWRQRGLPTYQHPLDARKRIYRSSDVQTFLTPRLVAAGREEASVA